VKQIAVIAHQGKTVGGGLDELRTELAAHGQTNPMWFEVPKSKYVPKAVRKALKDGAELIIIWGGDGSVQRSIDTLAGTSVPLAILPAGTGNLFATNLGIPKTVPEAVDAALNGFERTLDLGRVNGEHFGTMMGIGLDADMIKDADGGLKDALGRLAYVWTGARSIDSARFEARVDVDDKRFFKGSAGCVLVANMGQLTGGIEAFPDAKPDDGLLDVGVITADSLLDWTRALSRTAIGQAASSPFVEITRGKRIDIKTDRELLYEIDGGEREKTKKLKVRTKAGAIHVKVP
jgi:diacylglycerol kinase (ATP)